MVVRFGVLLHVLTVVMSRQNLMRSVIDCTQPIPCLYGHLGPVAVASVAS